MKLKDVMSKRVVTTTEGRTVREAARLMNRHDIGSIVVKRSGRVVGIVTERDVIRIVAGGKDAEKLRIKQVMSAPVIVGEETNDLQQAIKVMVLHKIKKLPVLRGKRLVGILTVTDFARVGPVVHDLLAKALEDSDAKAKKQAERMFKKYLPEREPPAHMYA